MARRISRALGADEARAHSTPLIRSSFRAILAARVNELMADRELRERFGKAGRKRAEEKFAWSAIARETKGSLRIVSRRDGSGPSAFLARCAKAV